MGRLCGRLRRRGIWAEDLRCVGDRWVVRHLLADRRAGRLHGPLIFVGHSCGGRYSLFAADRLAREGVTVDLLVCVDVALPRQVPANARKAVHYYLGQPRLYPASPLQPVPGSCSQINNVDLRIPPSAVSAAWIHHLNITDSAAVQGLVLGHILETIRSMPAKAPVAC
jgi:hypothetical protein